MIRRFPKDEFGSAIDTILGSNVLYIMKIIFCCISAATKEQSVSLAGFGGLGVQCGDVLEVMLSIWHLSVQCSSSV